jgi:two-component sensor histidine kinase
MSGLFSAKVVPQPPASVPAIETRLLGELAHRTANDLCSASTTVRQVRRHAWGPEQRQILDQLESQLDALGEIQRLMQAPVGEGMVDLGRQVAALCQAMVAARYAEQNISVLARVEDVVLDADQAWRILMIVAELLANAARQAFDHDGGTVLVDLSAREDAVICAIRDDGRGQLKGWVRLSDDGLSAVRILVQELGGRLEKVSSKTGAWIALTVPRTGTIASGAALEGSCQVN